MAVSCLVRIKRGVRDIEVSDTGSLCVERRGVLRNPTLLRLAKGMGELTKFYRFLLSVAWSVKNELAIRQDSGKYRRVIIYTPLVLGLAGPRTDLDKRRSRGEGTMRETDP